MCHEPSARPPLPPVSGGSSSGAPTLLKSADGTTFSAFAATTDRPEAPGVVILPDVRGLHPFYEELAVRFAEAGVHATAIDYFGRTAGTTPRGDDFDFMPHVTQTTAASLASDVAAGVAHVRSEDGGAASNVFTVGFCFGGRASFNQAGESHGLSGVIGFYGRLGDKRWEDDTPAPGSVAADYRCPMLGLFGGDDPGIPDTDIKAFREALDAAGVKNEIVVYEGAPHSFFDRSYERFAAECDDAWRRVLAFINREAVRAAD